MNTMTAGDGVRIAYRIDGDRDAPPLVLSNSIGTTFAMWDREVPLLTERFRVIRYDFRGHGGSDVPDGPTSIDRLGRDVLELLDALGVRRAHFLGLSLGGFVGQWLGVHAPERIDRLVLANTAAHLGPAAQWDAAIRQVLAAPDLRETAETFLHNWFPPEFFTHHADVIERFRDMLLRTDRRGIAAAWAAVRDADLRRTIALIPRPTLVIAGRHDTVTSLAHGEAIAGTVPGARLVVLPTVHLSNVERGAEFLDAVSTFLPEEATATVRRRTDRVAPAASSSAP